MNDLARDHIPGMKFYGWKLLAAFWLIVFISLGFANYGSSVINPYMAVGLHLDRKMLGLPYSVLSIMCGLPGPLVAFIINKKGVRFTMLAGCLLVLVGSLAMALFVNTGMQAVLAYGFVVGLGVISSGPLAAQAGVARWFVRRRAIALSILYSSSGCGGFIAAPLLDRVISAKGGNWRLGWWVIAALCVVSAAVAALFIKERPSDCGQLPDGGGPGRQAAADTDERPKRFGVHVTAERWTYREVLRSPAYWLMLASMLGASAASSLFLGQGVAHLKDLGHTPAAAAMSVSVMTISSFLVKFVIGALGDRFDPRYLWAATLASSGIAMMLLVNARGAGDLYPFAICLGIGFGGAIVCMMAVLGNYYGVAVFASIAGLGAALQTTISSIAPSLAGYLFDRYGTYATAFHIVGWWCFASTIVLLLIRPPVRGTASETA